VASSYEHGNERLGSIKGVEFLDQLSPVTTHSTFALLPSIILTRRSCKLLRWERD